MPRRPAKPCAQTGCPNKALPGKSRCEQHQAVLEARQQEVKREHDKRRGTRQERGYGASWQRLRKIVLNREPLCRHCKAMGKLTPAKEVDHIDGNVNNSSMNNLQPLCKGCHSRKTAKGRGIKS